jgi:hypothetical protein
VLVHPRPPKIKRPSLPKVHPSAARPSSTVVKTRRFPHPSHKGAGFVGKTIC